MPLPIYVAIQAILTMVAVFTAVKIYRSEPLHYRQRPSFQYYQQTRKKTRDAYNRRIGRVKKIPPHSRLRSNKELDATPKTDETGEQTAPWYTLGLAEAKAKTAARRNTPIASKPYPATITHTSHEQGWLASAGDTLPHGEFTSESTSVEGADLKSDATFYSHTGTTCILVALCVCIIVSFSLGFICTRKSKNARRTVDMVSDKRTVAYEDADTSDSDSDTETELDATPVANRTPADNEPVRDFLRELGLKGPTTRVTIPLPPMAFSQVPEFSSNSSTVASGPGAPPNPQSSSQPR